MHSDLKTEQAGFAKRDKKMELIDKTLMAKTEELKTEGNMDLLFSRFP